MKSPDPNTLRQLLAVAIRPPFSDVPMKMDFVLWEKEIPVGNASRWTEGDFLSLDQSSLNNVEVRLGGVAIGRGVIRETGSGVSVQLTSWPGDKA